MHGPASITSDVEPLEPFEAIGDEELTALALAADPDVILADDAVSLADVAGSGGGGLLPEWYMPPPSGGAPLLRGWRRRVGLLIIASFVAINAYGLCSTYGHVGFG